MTINIVISAICGFVIGIISTKIKAKKCAKELFEEEGYYCKEEYPRAIRAVKCFTQDIYGGELMKVIFLSNEHKMLKISMNFFNKHSEPRTYHHDVYFEEKETKALARLLEENCKEW